MNKHLAIIAACVLTACSAWASSNSVDIVNGPGKDYATPEQQKDNVVSPVQGTTTMIMNTSEARMGGLFMNFDKKRGGGLQFKDPVVAPAFTYRWANDTEPGGFNGNEYTGDIAMDADIYDGLIAGALYQYSHRSGQNAIGTSENLEANAFSLYAGKRLFDLLNLGLSYNFVTTEDRLSRAVIANLDRDSHGVTAMASLSDKKGAWLWSTGATMSFAADDYDQEKTLDTARFGWNGSVGADVTKWCTVLGTFNYYYLLVQDTFSGTPRDDDYWTLGPVFRFYPSDKVTVNLGFESTEGYAGYVSYALRLGADVAF